MDVTDSQHKASQKKETIASLTTLESKMHKQRAQHITCILYCFVQPMSLLTITENCYQLSELNASEQATELFGELQIFTRCMFGDNAIASHAK